MKTTAIFVLHFVYVKCGISYYVIKEHPMFSGANAKYLSPKIQNEIINICGSMIIEKIVSEVHESVPFSILADESPDVSAHEQCQYQFAT